MATETVNIGVFGAIKAIKNYNISNDPRDFEIDSFQSIGWPDPFPKPIPLA